jgi:hypothetical protein
MTSISDILTGIVIAWFIIKGIERLGSSWINGERLHEEARTRPGANVDPADGAKK